MAYSGPDGGAVPDHPAKHHHRLKTIFAEEELEEATCKDYLQVRLDPPRERPGQDSRDGETDFEQVWLPT